MTFERLASRSGPTEGVVVRPSDGQQPRSIAWLQCIGSRDQDKIFLLLHLLHVRHQGSDARQAAAGRRDRCTIFMMDERAFNKEYSTYFEGPPQDPRRQLHPLPGLGRARRPGEPAI
jgi:heterodisulfide reductase subunit A2